MKLFGTTLEIMRRGLGEPHFGDDEPTLQAAPEGLRAKHKAYVILVMSFIFIALGAYFVMMNMGQSQAIGASLLGAVVGYWIK